MRRLKADTVKLVSSIFDRLDYQKLGPIYCEEGGEEFWKARRGPCQKLGLKLAEVLLNRLKPKGQSLYVGAGVAEIPILAMETVELGRKISAFNLRADEVAILNQACNALPFRFVAGDAGAVRKRFDHLWMVSVLNDPERFPELSALSYGRANPVAFDPVAFARERRTVAALVKNCLMKLTRPGLITTSIEEIPWFIDWSRRWNVPCVVEDEDYPTAIVEDPVCFIRIGNPFR